MEGDDVPPEVELAILKHTPWDQLNPSVRKLVGNTKEIWHQVVVRFSLRRQLRWKTSFVRSLVNDERAYYTELVKQSKAKLMLYPYHISDVLVKGMRVTPFKYYLDILEDMLLNEKSYDSLPNFSAADGVRLLGIGRNQFIDLMNRSRSRSWLWKKRATIVKELLPSKPIPQEIEYWWIVHLGFVSQEDVQLSSDAERSMIDLLIARGSRCAGELDRDVLQLLHTRGLVYFDVTIEPTDLIAIPPLEGFVMNRVSGDFFENLLYKIFVTINEKLTIAELASLLQTDIEMVKWAVSIYCRLGFAKKKNLAPLHSLASEPNADRWHNSWLNVASAAMGGSQISRPASVNLANSAKVGATSGAGDELLLDDVHGGVSHGIPAEGSLGGTSFGAPANSESFQKAFGSVAQDASRNLKRIGFLFDSTLTAFLMMGNLGLKSHAVTMFEVGKLSDESLDEFLSLLDNQDGAQGEGDAQRYYDNAFTLRDSLRFFRRNEKCTVEGGDGGVDLLRCDSLNSLDVQTRLRILQKNYGLLITMAPLSVETRSIASRNPPHFGPPTPEANSAWFQLFVYNLVGSGPASQLFPKGMRVNRLPSAFTSCKAVLLSTWTADATVVPVTHLLPTLNDALLVSPVLLQAYSYSDEPLVVHVPFPLLPDHFEVADLPSKAGVPDAGLQAAVIAVNNALKLENSFGYIKMLQDERTRMWIPLEVRFGIPLFDPRLSRQIRERIERNRLFDNASLARHSENTADLVRRLLEFIGQHIDAGTGMASEEEEASAGATGVARVVLLPQVPYPNHPVEFMPSRPLIELPL